MAPLTVPIDSRRMQLVDNIPRQGRRRRCKTVAAHEFREEGKQSGFICKGHRLQVPCIVALSRKAQYSEKQTDDRLDFELGSSRLV